MQGVAGPASEPNQVRVGDVLGGRYQVVRIIGRGGMGVVVEGRSAGHGQRVAIKLLHQRHRDNAEAVARFAQEGRAAAQIRGEHSVRLYDSGTHEGCPFLVMELLVGRDMASLLEDGPVPLHEAATYLLQACEGIAEVHAHGMVHRDLKPSNLFLTEKPDGSPLVKILDFGIAKGVRADDESALVQTQTLIALGTPLYMSPEQIRSSQSVDARADVWSLGAIFYELVAGRPPFAGNTVTNITAQVLERDPPPLSSVARGAPPEVDAIIWNAMRKRPDERFVDVAALAAALEPFAGPECAGSAARSARILQGALRQDVVTTPPVAHDDGLGGTIRFDPRRRSRWMRGLVALLAVVAGVMVALAVTAYQSAKGASSQQLAKRGLRPAIGQMVDAATMGPTVAAAPSIVESTSAQPVEVAGDVASANASTTASVQTAPIAGIATPTVLAPQMTSAPQTTGTAQTFPGGRGVGPGAAAPSTAEHRPRPDPTAPPAAPPPATEEPFNPFSERN
ncbi:MAG: protein kinase [Polyangiaceae bacterium]|nr:protein kinase [Polyangiaceae bacterium]